MLLGQVIGYGRQVMDARLTGIMTRHGWGEQPVRRTAQGQVLITATDGVRYRLAGAPSSRPKSGTCAPRSIDVSRFDEA